MSREIKFRAWDKKEKKWFLGYEFPALGGFSMFGEVVMLGEWSELIYHRIKDLDNIALMQFTGFKDSKGKEIYEDDIVEEYYPRKAGERKGTRYYWPIVWINGSWCDADDGECVFDLLERLRVVGNIYENPELLK